MAENHASAEFANALEAKQAAPVRAETHQVTPTTAAAAAFDAPLDRSAPTELAS